MSGVTLRVPVLGEAALVLTHGLDVDLLLSRQAGLFNGLAVGGKLLLRHASIFGSGECLFYVGLFVNGGDLFLRGQ